MGRFLCDSCDAAVDSAVGRQIRVTTVVEGEFIQRDYYCCALCQALGLEAMKPRNWMGSPLEIQRRYDGISLIPAKAGEVNEPDAGHP